MAWRGVELKSHFTKIRCLQAHRERPSIFQIAVIEKTTLDKIPESQACNCQHPATGSDSEDTDLAVRRFTCAVESVKVMT